MTATTDKLIRIAPGNNRLSHSAYGVTIRKEDGWCRIPALLADRLARERMNDMNPAASPLVFEVRDVNADVNVPLPPEDGPRAGTLEEPKLKGFPDEAVAAEEKPARRPPRRKESP